MDVCKQCGAQAECDPVLGTCADCNQAANPAAPDDTPPQAPASEAAAPQESKPDRRKLLVGGGGGLMLLLGIKVALIVGKAELFLGKPKPPPPKPPQWNPVNRPPAWVLPQNGNPPGGVPKPPPRLPPQDDKPLPKPPGGNN